MGYLVLKPHSISRYYCIRSMGIYCKDTRVSNISIPIDWRMVMDFTLPGWQRLLAKLHASFETD